jgi:protein-S-isoprenylcysteine O-methyltransferase Ste14
MSCLLPTCLGYYKNEYGVSYAYGIATALTSYWIYKALCVGNTLATWHAGALMFYGIRLCLFLAYREAFVQRIKDSVQRIEEKAKARGSRLKRTPFILSCAGLYFGLCAPVLVTSQVALLSNNNVPKWTMTVLKSLVGCAWGGFLVAALGDFNKSIVKAIKGENHLVTGGLYRFLRHPNYTGEIIGWTANALAAIVAAIATKGVGIKPWPLFGYLFASILGAAGLDFVLVQATGGLEKRQKETYGDSEEYKQWVQKSWSGFIPPPQAVEDVIDEVMDPSVKPEIEPKVNEKEDGGSGI